MLQPNSNGMFTGAVAVLDLLGFKGSWRRFGATAIIEKMQNLVTRVPPEPVRVVGATGPEPTRVVGAEGPELANTVRFISDTIVLAVARAPGQDADAMAAAALTGVANTVGSIHRWMLREPAPFALRGAIAWGDFLIEDNFMVGPAVDEAASMGGRAEAAVEFFCPSALLEIERLASRTNRTGSAVGTFGLLYNAPITRWSVPMKSGARIRTAVVAIDGPLEENRTATSAAFRMDEVQPLDVVIKYQNTIEFLEHQEEGAGNIGKGWFAVKANRAR